MHASLRDGVCVMTDCSCEWYNCNERERSSPHTPSPRASPSQRPQDPSPTNTQNLRYPPNGPKRAQASRLIRAWTHRI